MPNKPSSPAPLTVEQQFELLRASMRDSPRPTAWEELARTRFGGELSRVTSLFTITRAMYLDWARTLPVAHAMRHCPPFGIGSTLK